MSCVELFELCNTQCFVFLASQDAPEVVGVTDSALADLTDVTLVSDDTYRDLTDMTLVSGV